MTLSRTALCQMTLSKRILTECLPLFESSPLWFCWCLDIKQNNTMPNDTHQKDILQNASPFLKAPHFDFAGATTLRRTANHQWHRAKGLLTECLPLFESSPLWFCWCHDIKQNNTMPNDTHQKDILQNASPFLKAPHFDFVGATTLRRTANHQWHRAKGLLIECLALFESSPLCFCWCHNI
jgi:hypothetical protein